MKNILFILVLLFITNPSLAQQTFTPLEYWDFDNVTDLSVDNGDVLTGTNGYNLESVHGTVSGVY